MQKEDTMKPSGWFLGVVCAAMVVACSDSAPPMSGTDRDDQNLDVFVPTPVGDIPTIREVFTGSAIDSGQGDPLSLIWDAESKSGDNKGESGTKKGGGDGDTWPLIHDAYATLRFEAKKIALDYGMRGVGNFYSMAPTVDVFTMDNKKVLTHAGKGRSESWFMAAPFTFRPIAQDEIVLENDCGMHANLTVYFEAGYLGGREQKVVRHSAKAKACPNPSSGGASGGPGTTEGGTRFTICYYEIHLDMNGYVVDVIPLGCYTTSTGPLMA